MGKRLRYLLCAYIHSGHNWQHIGSLGFHPVWQCDKCGKVTFQ